MLCKEVRDYLSGTNRLPFFYIIGDTGYTEVLDNLKQVGCSLVRVSDFCSKPDRFPSIDSMMDQFLTSDVNYKDKKFIVVGLGEYLALKGEKVARDEIYRLKDKILGNIRIVFLLRGIYNQVATIINSDNRLIQQHRYYLADNVHTNIEIINIKGDVNIQHVTDVKTLLKYLEDGNSGDVYAELGISLDYSLFPITTYNAHSLIRKMHPEFSVASSCGTEIYWERFVKDLQNCGNAISNIFEMYSINDEIDELYTNVSGLEYRNWLFFIFLKLQKGVLQNDYLKYVIDKTTNFENLKNNLILRILDFTHKDKNFMSLYKGRKSILRQFPDEDIAIFMENNELDLEESIYRYTDNTLLEKKAIVKWIAQNGENEAISYVYPALDAYLKKYHFECQLFSKELTDYFDKYKHQKLNNKISDDFIQLVNKYADSQIYAQLPTRDNAINQIQNKDKAFLYWIDALGVEYLSYITSLAKEKGLSMRIDIVRADLPTITSVNKGFYDLWQGDKYKEEKLDNIKHKESGGYFFTNDPTPIHIPDELLVIEKALNTAAYKLRLHQCKSFVIASDHGASRLAVIKKQEVPYDTETKGEHSGRCCKYFPGCDLRYKIEDNDYIILSDYGRFKGSRVANVEVHGGATLEEIVIPLITLSLKKSSGIIVKILDEDNIKADHEGVKLTLFISEVDFPNNVTIRIDGYKPYPGKAIGKSKFYFVLEDIKRSKAQPYDASIFDGDDLIGSISFTVKGKIASFNRDFDNFD